MAFVRYLITFVVTLSITGLYTSSNAQEISNQLVRSIEFKGLVKTKPSFLQTLVDITEESPWSEMVLESDLKKLKNVPGIGDANYQVDSTNQELKVTFFIEEVRTSVPIVNFGGIKDNLWFQLGFSDINWRGKGQYLIAYYQYNDSRHSGEIYFRVPRVRGSEWGYSVSLRKWSSVEPLFFDEGTVNYDYDNNSFGLMAIRRLGPHRSLEFGGNYFVEKYAKSKEQFLQEPPGPDTFRQPKLLGKIEYKEDFLNYHLFYLQGSTWQVSLQNVFNTLDNSWFQSLQFQGKKFMRPGRNINLAFRLKLAVSTNNDTPFAPFVADSHVNLRGVGNRIDRGTAQAVLNSEFRHTIFSSSSWGGQFVAFSDLGTWRNPGGQLKDLLDPDQFRQFVGGGFRIIYQKVYGAALRIDYGVDVFNPQQRGLVIGFGQYF